MNKCVCKVNCHFDQLQILVIRIHHRLIQQVRQYPRVLQRTASTDTQQVRFLVMKYITQKVCIGHFGFNYNTGIIRTSPACKEFHYHFSILCKRHSNMSVLYLTLIFSHDHWLKEPISVTRYNFDTHSGDSTSIAYLVLMNNIYFVLFSF